MSNTLAYFVSSNHTLLSVVLTLNASSRPFGEGVGLPNHLPVSSRRTSTLPSLLTCKRSLPSRRFVVTNRARPSADHDNELSDVLPVNGISRAVPPLRENTVR